MKILRKKVLAVILSVLMLLSMSTVIASAAAATTVAIDGKTISIPSSYGAPYVDSANRTQIPIRAISEALGVTVAWDQPTQTAIIDSNIKIKLGANSIATPNGAIAMDTTAVSSNGRIYVPFRFLCNALGYDVEYTTAGVNTTVNIITKVELNISAAASLTDALKEIQQLYLVKKPNSKVVFNFGASGTLETQIKNGAPVDVFFSAATSNMNNLKTAGLLLDSTVKNLLGNDVVLIAPSNSKLSLSSFTAVTGSGIKMIALGEPTAVPAGKYAKEVFTYYNIWDQVSAKATFGTDVRQVLTMVETGNADCGVVYSTDAATSATVKIVATAIDASHTPIIYPAAVIKASAHSAAAADFVNFLSSAGAKAVFVKYGFRTL